MILIKGPASVPGPGKFVASGRAQKKARMTECFQAVLLNLVSGTIPRTAQEPLTCESVPTAPEIPMQLSGCGLALGSSPSSPGVS